MLESGQRSLKPADHVFPCNPAVKAGNGASSTACKIHDHLRSFISKRLMPMMFPALGWEGSGAMEMKLWILSLRVTVRWGTQMSGLDNVAWRGLGRTPEKRREKGTQPSSARRWQSICGFKELNGVPPQKRYVGVLTSSTSECGLIWT